MQKIFAILTLTCFGLISSAQNRNWDKPMQLKSCNIQIKADLFTATTFIEMEFYNPNGQEIEGLYQFQLQPGQAITAFQLDLYGKYRDGSVEEKWKAANAYNTIVGKRIDPALLQMDSYNNYSLRIYPIAARGTRKITMTMQQLLKINKESLEYYLPLNVKDTVRSFKMEIAVSNSQTIPYSKDGLLTSQTFSGTAAIQKLSYTASDLLLNKPIVFHIPLMTGGTVCTQQVNDNTHFALRMTPSFQKTYAVSPKKIKVFWDISASGNKRNAAKEISFLKQYIAYHNIQQLEITTFNYNVQQSQSFTVDEQNGKWASFLRSLEYEGATQIGCIDLSKVNADAVFLFTDGNNSYGNAMPKGEDQYVYCVHASDNTDNVQLDKIVGESGGKNIDLLKVSMHEAIQMGSSAENMLMDIRSTSGKSIINFQHYYKDQNLLLITGILNGSSDSLIFYYGNNNRASGKEKMALSSANCSGSAIDRIQTLSEFDALIKTNRWQDILFFGKEQRIVTPNTSYIVLERIEDYVRYQIEPPKELEDECAKMGFVKADRNIKLQQHNKLTEFQILTSVVQTYNARMKTWGNESLIALSAPKADDKTVTEKSTKQESVATASISAEPLGKDFRSNLEEVVVIGYGTQRKRSVTGSVSVIRANEIAQGSTSIEQVLSGRVAGLQITPTNNFQTGDLSSIRIRGMSSMGNSQPLYVVDGMPVSGNINNSVSPNDIEYIEVLKDASATALYGSRGGNGVIYIKTKEGKNLNNYYSEKPYKLSDMEDEDYLADIKSVDRDEKWGKYKALQSVHGSSAVFYLDIAQHFREAGFKNEAITVLSNAAEVSSGNLTVLKAMAFMLEQWGAYNEALELYLQISKSNPNDIKAYRDIALVYYQKGAYQKAVDVLYEGITKNTEANEGANTEVKALLLNDLNAIAAIHKDHLNLSAVNTVILKPVSVDLRIVVDCNNPYAYNQLSIVEPGGAVAQQAGSKTKNGGYIAYGHNYGTREYGIKEAKTGKYKVRINYYDRSQNNTDVPVMIKLTTFKNFGKQNQSIHIENVIMNNQNGIVEVAEIKW